MGMPLNPAMTKFLMNWYRREKTGGRISTFLSANELHQDDLGATLYLAIVWQGIGTFVLPLWHSSQGAGFAVPRSTRAKFIFLLQKSLQKHLLPPVTLDGYFHLSRQV